MSPVLPLVIPLAGTAAIALARRHPAVRDGVTLATCVALLGAVAAFAPSVLAGARPLAVLVDVAPGLSLALRVEPLGLLYALVASSLWLPTSVYSIGYVRAKRERNQTRYFACFALSLASAIGIAFSANLFTLFVFYEALTLVTYPLVTHAGTERALEGGRTYLGWLLGSSVSLLFAAIAATWALAGDLEFRPGGVLEGTASSTVLALVLALFAFGLGKAALMPLHRWLPAAMVAPTPVSALLHAVAVVKAGVFALTKVVLQVFGLRTLSGTGAADWLVWVAAASLLCAGALAMRQDDLKRRLAYSTVSQLAYVTLAAALATPLAAAGAALQVAAHAVAKITLFFCAGAVQVASGKTRVSQLRGLGRRMPWTMGAFALASLSLIGVPPVAGFLSKWSILQGAAQAGSAVGVAALLGGTLLAAGYLLPIVHDAFLREPEDGAPHGEAPPLMVVPLVATALATILLFVAPGWLGAVGEAVAREGSAVVASAAGGAP